MTESDPIFAAIERHKTIQAAYDASIGASDETLHFLSEAEREAYEELAEMPCANDGEFLEKLKYLAAREIRLFGEPSLGANNGHVAVAVAKHFRLGADASSSRRFTREGTEMAK